MHRLKHGIVSLVLLSSNPSITVVHFPIYTLCSLYKNPIWEIFTSQVCCSRNLIIFLTRDKFLGCTCQEWRLPVGPYQIQRIHFLCRYRSRAAGGYYSVCLSACDFQLPARSGCFASTACCLPPPVPSLPGHILLFLSADSSTLDMQGGGTHSGRSYFFLAKALNLFKIHLLEIWENKPFLCRCENKWGFLFMYLFWGDILTWMTWTKKSDMLGSDRSSSTCRGHSETWVLLPSVFFVHILDWVSFLAVVYKQTERWLHWENPAEARLLSHGAVNTRQPWAFAADAHNAFFLRY